MNMMLEDWFITPAEFAEKFSHAEAFARSLAKDTASIMPHLLIHTVGANGERELVISAMAVAFNEEAEKAQALFNVGQMLRQKQQAPMAVFMISEAWFAKGPREIEPRHNPERREVLAIFGTDITFEQRMIADADITRGPENKIILAPGFTKHPQARVPILQHLLHGFLAKDLGIRSWDEQPGFVA
jgi:hypothetical protein